MSNGSLFLEFDKATAVGRARLRPSWARLYPALERGRWYKVLDVGQTEFGVFIDAGQPRYVSRSHFQIEPMPGQSR